VVTIKRIRLEDIPAVVEFGKTFYYQTPWAYHGINYDDQHVNNVLTYLDTDGIMQMAVDEDKIVGFLLAIAGPFPFNPAYTISTELAFYVDPKYRNGRVGIKLIKQAEFVARQKGIRFFNMISISGVGLKDPGKLYEKMGLNKTETVYMKELI
jgi:GNAT superfamily N-acetyltransferase